MKKEGKTWTVLEIVRWTSDYFKEKGIDSPRLTAELILCEALGIKRIDIYTNFEKPLQKDELDKIREMVNRRGKREPLQYILGKAHFLDIEIMVDKSVLIPRPETELLVHEVLKTIPDKETELRIADLGTGSGCIAIALGKNLPKAEILAYDNSDKALDVARKNAQLNNVNNVKCIEYNIVNELSSQGAFDLIVSNPPYIPLKDYNELEPEVLKYEPKEALTDGGDGLSFYHIFARNLNLSLKPGGAMFLEIGFDQGESIKAIFQEAGFNVIIIKDYSGLDRIVKIN